MARPNRKVNATFVLIALLGLSACGIFDRPRVPRGNAVDAEQLAQIRPGVQTRQDVQALLGSPTARGTFDEENWYYISAQTRVQPGRFLQIEDQRVVAISFDRNGTVRGIREVNQAETRPVEMVGRETPVPGTERSLLQALFGNLGRATLPAGQGGPGSVGAPGRL
jgi:outer membrane protein assembly factor BamE (lipoprotein component of BamABCDE complex)